MRKSVHDKIHYNGAELRPLIRIFLSFVFTFALLTTIRGACNITPNKNTQTNAAHSPGSSGSILSQKACSRLNKSVSPPRMVGGSLMGSLVGGASFDRRLFVSVFRRGPAGQTRRAGLMWAAAVTELELGHRREALGCIGHCSQLLL